MPDSAVFSTETGVAILMLIVAFRSLTWHRISRPLSSLLLLLVLVATWEMLAKSGHISFERGLLFAFCFLLGLVVGFARGQAAPMRYDRREDDAVCRRGAVLIFGWAAVSLAIIALHTTPGLFNATWQLGLIAVLLFLTASFLSSTLTLFARMNEVRQEGQFQPTEELQSHPS